MPDAPVTHEIASGQFAKLAREATLPQGAVPGGKSLAGAASEFLKKDAGQLAVADPRLIAEAATDLITAHAGLIQAQHNYDYARRQA